MEKILVAGVAEVYEDFFLIQYLFRLLFLSSVGSGKNLVTNSVTKEILCLPFYPSLDFMK